MFYLHDMLIRVVSGECEWSHITMADGTSVCLGHTEMANLNLKGGSSDMPIPTAVSW